MNLICACMYLKNMIVWIFDLKNMIVWIFDLKNVIVWIFDMKNVIIPNILQTITFLWTVLTEKFSVTFLRTVTGRLTFFLWLSTETYRHIYI